MPPVKAKAQAEEAEPRDLNTINDIADELLPDASPAEKPHLLAIKAAVARVRAAEKTAQSMIRPEGE